MKYVTTSLCSVAALVESDTSYEEDSMDFRYTKVVFQNSVSLSRCGNKNVSDSTPINILYFGVVIKIVVIIFKSDGFLARWIKIARTLILIFRVSTTPQSLFEYHDSY